MGLSDAKRDLQWKVVMEALSVADVDADTIEVVKSARSAAEIVNGAARMLLAGADTKQAENYVKVEMVGMTPPFDRAYVELIRHGGKTSHELRGLLRDRLERVRQLLAAGEPSGGQREDMIDAIDRVLATEAP